MTEPSGITKLEGGTGAGLNMWGKARVKSGCSRILLHPEPDMAECLRSMAVCGEWAVGLWWCDGEVVWGCCGFEGSGDGYGANGCGSGGE